MGDARSGGKLSKLVGAERLTSVGHEHLDTYMVLPLAMLAAGARKGAVPPSGHQLPTRNVPG